MYKQETSRRIEGALGCVLAQGGVLPNLTSSDSQEIAETIHLLAKMLADQLWFEGYELHLRNAHGPASSPGLDRNQSLTL